MHGHSGRLPWAVRWRLHSGNTGQPDSGILGIGRERERLGWTGDRSPAVEGVRGHVEEAPRVWARSRTGFSAGESKGQSWMEWCSGPRSEIEGNRGNGDGKTQQTQYEASQSFH